MLFHGSKQKIEGNLRPGVSYELKSWVYATDDIFYALVRSGNFDVSKFRIREEYSGKDEVFELAEVYDGAFKEVFDRPGYIYLVDQKNFVKSPRYNEFVSEHEIPIVTTITIPNIWEEILKYPDKYKLVYDKDSEEYWSKVTGGKEGYLARKKKALENIMRARA